MPHVIKYNSETQIVELKFHGNIFLNEIQEIYSHALQTAKDNDTFLFLSDYSDAELSLSTVDIFNLPKLFAEIAVEIGFSPYKLKRAVVPTQKLDDFSFFETVSFNRGQSLAKIFQDVEEAEKWLTEK